MTGQRDLPNLGLTNRWTPGSSGWAPDMDANLARLDALTQAVALSASIADPPATPASGDRYVIPTGATGAWAGRAVQIAVWLDAAWKFYQPRAGWKIYVLEVTADYIYDGTSWQRRYQPYDFQVFASKVPPVGQPLLSLMIPRTTLLRANLPLSLATARVASQALAMLPITRNDVQIGAINFGAGSTTGTFTFASDVTLAAGDVFEVVPPSTVDPLLAGVRFVIVGYR